MKILKLIFVFMLICTVSNASNCDESLRGKTLCVFGDSYVRNHKRPFSESWHSKVAEKLGMNYVNFGRNGSSIAFDRTADGFGPAMTVRYKEMPDSADVILIIAGHNDADYLSNHEGVWPEFCAGLDSLLSGLKEKYPSKPIGFVTPWGVGRANFNEVIAQIHKACEKYDIPVLDVSSSEIIDVNNPEFRAVYFQGPNDTAHLNDKGHNLMVDRGEAFLKSFVNGGKCCGKHKHKMNVPRDTSFTTHSTYVKVIKHHPEVTLALPDQMDGLRAYRDVVYTTHRNSPYGDRDMHVDIFRPDDDNTYPALIMIHGGGWNSGAKSLQVPMAQRIAAKGYVTIPVEYRLVPEAKYPAGFHDIKTAVRWVRKNAEKYGINPDKIAVSGCSAGAQLATLTGVTNGLKRHEGVGEWLDVASDVQAIINMDGCSTFVSESNIAEANDKLAQKGELPINAVWLGGLYEEAKDNWEEASPVLWVTDKSAPICFINSGLPRYSDGRDTLLKCYEGKGIYSERHVIPVDVHPYWFFYPWIEPTIDYAVSFLDKVFK